MTYHYKREIYYHIFIMCYVHYFVTWESPLVACMCVEHRCVYWMCVCGTLVPWAVPERQCSHSRITPVRLPGRWQAPDSVAGEVQSNLALVLLWTSLDCWTEIPLQWRSAQCCSVCGRWKTLKPRASLNFTCRKPHLIALLCLWDLSLREGSQIIWNNLLH